MRVPPAGAALVVEEATAALGTGRFGRTGGAAYSSLVGGDGAGAAAVVDTAMPCAAGNVALVKGMLGLPGPATWYNAFTAREASGVAVEVVDAWGGAA